MISMQKKFLFIHVPKTGGNSIQNVLSKYSEDEIVILNKHQDGIERFEVRNNEYDVTKHSTLSHYRSVLKANIYRSLFKFATIRNPWDMMISFYFSPHRGFTEWNRQIFLSLIESMSPLSHYICEKPSIRKGEGNSSIYTDVDFLMRFERLDDDFKVVCAKLDIPYSRLPKRNSSTRSHYSRYYDEELQEIVRQKFIEEITFGNYIFENA
jgi:hypothetical protein